MHWMLLLDIFENQETNTSLKLSVFDFLMFIEKNLWNAITFFFWFELHTLYWIRMQWEEMSIQTPWNCSLKKIWHFRKTYRHILDNNKNYIDPFTIFWCHLCSKHFYRQKTKKSKHDNAKNKPKIIQDVNFSLDIDFHTKVSKHCWSSQCKNLNIACQCVFFNPF